MKLYYRNNTGQTVDLSEWPIMYQEPESLFEKAWKYDYKDYAAYGGKVSRFYRGIEEKPLKIAVFAENEEMFSEVMEHMEECFESDIANLSPGRLYVNDAYLRCFIRQSSYSAYEEDFYTTDQQLTILAEYPFWITERPYVFKAAEITSTDNKRYANRYSYRYANGMNNVNIINDHFAECNFKMIIYGPCVNPHIIIGGHTYQNYIVLEAGEYLTVDSMAKTVFKTMNNGTVVNVFNSREKSVFQKIPPGLNTVKWPGTFDFDIILFEERSGPI